MGVIGLSNIINFGAQSSNGMNVDLLYSNNITGSATTSLTLCPAPTNINQYQAVLIQIYVNSITVNVPSGNNTTDFVFSNQTDTSITIMSARLGSRSQTYRSGNFYMINSIFTKTGDSITFSSSNICTPGNFYNTYYQNNDSTYLFSLFGDNNDENLRLQIPVIGAQRVSIDYDFDINLYGFSI